MSDIKIIKTTFSIYKDQYNDLKVMGGNILEDGKGMSWHVRKAIDQYLHPEVAQTIRMTVKENYDHPQSK